MAKRSTFTPSMGRTARAIMAEREAAPPPEPHWFTATIAKPPTLNNLYPSRGKGGGRFKSKAYHTWIAGATARLMKQRPPRIEAEYELRIELGRRKGSDLDNYAKAISDLLKPLGIVKDDKLCERLEITWADDLKSAEARIHIRAWVRNRTQVRKREPVRGISAESVARPALRYHGGKWRLAPWIIEHLPPHRIFVEPFGGGASVLLRKPRSYAEVYNELDPDVVNFFSVLRDDGEELQRLLRCTPFARDEYLGSHTPSDDPIERARQLVVRSFMGFGSDSASGVNSGFRANANRANTVPAHDWSNYPEALPVLIERLRGIVIENRDALECMAQHDGPQTLHYVDPPYLHATRSNARGKAKSYRHEMSDADHARLLEFLKGLTGAVVLSGYPSKLYDAALAGWERAERKALADGARERTEVIWLNPRAVEGLRQRDPAQLAFHDKLEKSQFTPATAPVIPKLGTNPARARKPRPNAKGLYIERTEAGEQFSLVAEPKAPLKPQPMPRKSVRPARKGRAR